MNSFGTIFRLTCFGESHGEAIGGIIDGMPAGVSIDLEAVQHQLDRRRPGQSDLTSRRNEADRLRILSGILHDKTLGTPIGFIVENTNQRPEDYDILENIFRPSHADFTYQAKYGIRDQRGGGRASARTTIPMVVAGAIARQVLEQYGIKIQAYTSAIGNISLKKHYSELNLSIVDQNEVRCPDKSVAERMIKLINKVRTEGDTLGGVATCIISGTPVGLGEPIFGKLQSRLAAAMMSINAAKGFEYGMGFDGCTKRGSETIDLFTSETGKITTLTNHSGGIQGGISNGGDIYFNVAFKPVATLMKEVRTVDADGKPIMLKMKGRHDPCVLPRVIPIVESLAACVILDALLLRSVSTLHH